MNALHYDALPHALTSSAQWVCFKLEEKQGKLTKEPYNARNGRHADTSKAYTWTSFQDAVDALHRYTTLGYAVYEHNSVRVLDLDHCRDKETGRLEQWARAIIDRLDSYTEVSPSGTGVHIFVRADITRENRVHKLGNGQVEFYTTRHFITVTGVHLDGTPRTIEERTDALSSLYDEYFPQSETQESFLVDASDSDIEEARQWLATYAEEHQNSDRSNFFQTLVSAAYLKYGTGAVMALSDDINAASGSKYGHKRIEREITRSLQKAQSLPRTEKPRHKQAEKTPYSYAWQEKSETKNERDSYLDAIGEGIKARVRTHSENGRGVLHVESVPPGIGKSHKVAQLGNEGYNTAWIAENHKQIESVKPLASYRHIEGCNSRNCEYHLAHNELARRGYPTVLVHKLHNEPCDYIKQFDTSTSAVYQIGHVETYHPTAHNSIIIDELDIPRWIDEREISIAALDDALYEIGTFTGAAYNLLSVTKRTIQAVGKEKATIHGKMLFDALQSWCYGNLDAWLDELIEDKEAMRERPFTSLSGNNADEIAQAAMEKHSIVLPYLVKALVSERNKWQRGTAWNSCLEIKLGKHGYALFVSDVKRFTSKSGAVPAMTLLDATANKILLSRLFAMNVKIDRVTIEPPPHMRHIAVRTGKRYSKTSLERKEDKDRKRVIAECRYLLHEIDPNGTKKVGLISYMGCVDEIAEALRIPEKHRGYFWNMRGSNALEDCDILLVIGTPTLRPDAIARIARVLYQDDETPIDETSDIVDDMRMYCDAKMQHLSDYLIEAELTQCAHRNRALRHDGRIVVSMCNAKIGYLPVTEEYSALPQLESTGQERGAVQEQSEIAKLEAAAARLQEQGKKVSVRNMMQEAHIKRDTAAAWCKQHKKLDMCYTEDKESVPHNAIDNIFIAKRGTFLESETPNEPHVLPYNDPRLDRFSHTMQGTWKAKKEHFFRGNHPILSNGYIEREEYIRNVEDALRSSDYRLIAWANDEIDRHYQEAS